jgi:hypothetical protein
MDVVTLEMRRLNGTVLYPNAAVPSSYPAPPKTTANSVSFSLGCHLESGWPPRGGRGTKNKHIPKIYSDLLLHLDNEWNKCIVRV